jgi:hypothetical protein
MLVLSPRMSTDTGTKMSASFWLFCSEVRTSKTNWPETLFVTMNRNSCRCVCNLRFKHFSCIPCEHHWVLRTMSVPKNISTQSKLSVHPGFFCRLFPCFLPQKPGCGSSPGKTALWGCRFDPRNPRWAMNISTQPGFACNTLNFFLLSLSMCETSIGLFQSIIQWVCLMKKPNNLNSLKSIGPQGMHMRWMHKCFHSHNYEVLLPKSVFYVWHWYQIWHKFLKFWQLSLLVN